MVNRCSFLYARHLLIESTAAGLTVIEPRGSDDVIFGETVSGNVISWEGSAIAFIFGRGPPGMLANGGLP